MSHLKGRPGLMKGKGNVKLSEALNELLAGELAGINQYFIHAKMCEHWGYKRLAARRILDAENPTQPRAPLGPARPFTTWVPEDGLM